ncbi:hypothetical protein M758_3G040200 [Ceratodon purpureus]|nr:hypothetical protein M758_3G040200 [Ceratodon purpureus]
MATKPRTKRAPKGGEPAVEKENVDVSPVSSKGAAKKGANLSLQEELEAMTRALQQVSLEKEQNEAKLREKDEQLSAQAAEAERIQNLLKSSDEEKKRLEEKLRKLQKGQGFQPTLNFSMAAPMSPEDLSKKKRKDPNRLKRPKSAFLLWCKDHRQKVCEENPNATFAEISTIMGDKWKNVSEDERKPYEDRCKVEKDIYLKLVGKEKRETEALKLFHEEQNKKQAQELLEQYLAYKKEAEMDNGKKKKKEKDPLKPKHPISAFFAFSQSRRPALLEEKKPITEISKILGEEWKTLSSAERAPFDEIAVKDKERYSTELEAYKRNKAEDLSIMEREAEEKSKIEKAQALQLYKQKEKLEQAKKVMKQQTKEKKDQSKEKKDQATEGKDKKEPPKDKKDDVKEKKVVTQDKKDQAKEKKAVTQEKKAAIQETKNVAQEKKDQAKEKKKARDPNKPKKPLSSYLIFGQEMRKTLATDQAGLNFAETNAHISQKWKEISEKDKEIWNEKAAVLKQKYDVDMEEYRKTNPEPSV